MEEEFQESDVIFTDYGFCDNEDGNFSKYQEMVMSTQKNRSIPRKKKRRSKVAAAAANSAPVSINISDNIFQYVDTDIFEEEYEDGERIPPHVIVERRISGKMAFSVCTGNGRTLKGRDLSQVRNAILRMTGFLET